MGSGEWGEASGQQEGEGSEAEGLSRWHRWLQGGGDCQLGNSSIGRVSDRDESRGDRGCQEQRQGKFRGDRWRRMANSLIWGGVREPQRCLTQNWIH